jgi:TonB family protein
VAAGFLDLLRNPPSATTAEAPSVFVPPMVIRQPLPAWEAPPERVAERGVLGTLRVAIGSDGSVMSATVEQGIDPRYDAVLVAAAREWRYEPARLNGVAVESEKVIDIRFGSTHTATHR